jgi:hypothetical protein
MRRNGARNGERKKIGLYERERERPHSFSVDPLGYIHLGMHGNHIRISWLACFSNRNGTGTGNKTIASVNFNATSPVVFPCIDDTIVSAN